MADGSRAAIGSVRDEGAVLRRLLALSLVCATSLTCQWGCHQSGSAPEAPVPQRSEARIADAPWIVLTSLEHDFGQIGPETSHQAEFRFTNEGTAPLKITQVKSCCGVVTKGVKAGQTYAPGERGVLKLDYRAGMQPGLMKRPLYIQSNDPVQSVVTLTVEATIVPRVRSEPSSLKLFLEQNNAGVGEITLTALDGRPFAIKAFQATGKTLQADVDPQVQATQFVLKPIVDMEKLEKNQHGQIRIDLTHPECQNIRLFYDVLPEFTVRPPNLMLFNLEPGRAVERTIGISSNYREDFEIDSVVAQEGTVTVLSQTKVQNRYQLKVQIMPPPPADEPTVLSDTIEVTVQDGRAIHVPVYFNGAR